MYCNTRQPVIRYVQLILNIFTFKKIHKDKITVIIIGYFIDIYINNFASIFFVLFTEINI